MKRTLPLALLCLSAAWTYACSDDKSEPTDTPQEDGGGPTTPPDEDGGTTTPKPDGSTTTPDGSTTTPDGSVATGNPLEGTAAPKVITPNDFNDFADGPLFLNGKLYYTLPLSNLVIEFTPPSTFSQVRNYTANVPVYSPIGQTFDPKTNTVVTVEAEVSATATANRLVRWTNVANQPTPINLAFDAGSGANPFDSPNDVVARADGTLYVTDPGYQKSNAGGATTNRIVRITATNQVFEEKVYALSEKPNGIALSPDGNTLYVSLTDRNKVVKFPVNANGALGAESDFTTGTTQPDGLCVDTAGNVYVTTATGVSVYKADGTKWPTAIETKKGAQSIAATAVAFGGADLKTLYITAQGAVFEVTGLKVAGTKQ
jgi:gluconolactonase